MTAPSQARHDDDVLERNVETLLEAGGDPPRLAAAARTRMRDHLLTAHGAGANVAWFRAPAVRTGFRLAAIAAGVLIVARVVGGHHDAATPEVTRHDDELALADGTTVTTAPGAHVEVLGPRHVRVEGAALLDVVPGHGTFVVDTARGHIEVLGTRFMVEADGAHTTTAVVRGEVKLVDDSGDVTLHAGEQGTAEAGHVPTRGPAPRLSQLVSWAREARHRDEHDVQPLRHGTLYAREPNRPWMPETALPIAKLTVDVVVEDQVARVALDQTFHNPAAIDMEGMYRFAIPPDAALQRLAMYNHGKLTESAVVERMSARRIYEDAVYRRVDPALLEWAGTGRLALRVYPLPAQQDKRLVLAYTQSLRKLYDDWTLTVPLPEIDEPVGELAFDVRVRDCASCEVTSTSHQVRVTRDGDDAIVHYDAKHERIGDSLVLHVRDPRKIARVATAHAGADSFVMVRAPADLHAAPHAYRPRTWVILDDVSASRDALARRGQADLIDAFLRELDENDRVSVLTFDVAARKILPPTRVLDVDRVAVRTALRGEPGGVGATDLGAALDAAVATFAAAGTAPADAMIVYLGDGVISAGPRTLDTLRAQIVGKAQFVGVGVGDGPDTQTLDSLAAATGGYTTTIDLADDLGWRAFDLVAALHTTRVTGLAARLVDASGALVPSTLYLPAQVADGEELELVGKLAGSGSPAAAELTGTLDGAPWSRRISLADAVHPSGDAGFLPRLWAQRHIAARLLAKHEPVDVPVCATATPPTIGPRTKTAAAECPSEAELREARDEAIRKDVVELGKHYFLLSRHTSLLVLEDDAMYARYGVTKGAGDTWAPYALPATIVVPPPTTIATSVPEDTLLVRSPMPMFADTGGYGISTGRTFESALGASAGSQSDFSGVSFSGSTSLENRYVVDRSELGLGTRGLGTIGHGAGIGTGHGKGGDDQPETGGDAKPDAEKVAGPMATATPMSDKNKDEQTAAQSGVLDVLGGVAGDVDSHDRAHLAEAPREVATISTKELNGTGQGYGVGGGRGGLRGRIQSISTVTIGEGSFGKVGAYNGYYANGGYGAQLAPMHFTYAADPAFDDVTAHVPALFADASDTWRATFAAASDGATTHAIDDAARTILTEARRRLATGVYRWDGVEVAVDAARHLGERRTTDAGLVETASVDDATWTRRYAELDLDVTRAITTADAGVALASLPILIAEPTQWTRWFKVSARGAHEVALTGTTHGVDHLAYVLVFDDAYHLTAIRDGNGHDVLTVTWSADGPTAATLVGHAIEVGFTGQQIGDAAAWAHGSAPASGVVVELPGHMPAYWRERVTAATTTAGSPEWRRAERQRLVADAAVGDRNDAWTAYSELLAHGGVELGDLVLASAGVATSTTDAQLVSALAPWHAMAAADRPALVRYLAAGRAYGQAPDPAKLAHVNTAGTPGLVDSLWSVREIVAQVAAGHGRTAVDHLVALGAGGAGDQRALALRLVAASVIAQHYELSVADLARAWDSVAVGAYRNLARGQAALWLYYRGQPDLAADRVVALVADLDLSAPPVALGFAPQLFAQSRRGTAGWQLAWATWRDRVLAGGSVEHVLALLGDAQQQPNDLAPIFARAAALAANDAAELTGIVELAVSYGQTAWAQPILDGLLKRAPSRELDQLSAQLLLAQGRQGDALVELEAAQDAGADEAVDLSVVRAELGQIIGLARTVALATTGTAREQVVQRALRWGDRWRAIDPGNAAIDEQLGELELAVGNRAEAWRQLSSVIERDPMSGDGYAIVADAFERQGRVAEAIEFWQQAVVIDQTNPTPRLRKAQALYAIGKTADADALVADIAGRRWHARWAGVVAQVDALRERSKQAAAAAQQQQR